MPRIARRLLVEDESTNHCSWRAHDHMKVFEVDGAREEFLRLIAAYKEAEGILIHSYCLMGTHPHVVCTSNKGQAGFSAFWKNVNQAFAKWINMVKGRKGQVIMERLVSPRIQRDGVHLLTVMKYGDMNPVRAGLVKSAKDWKWSSYRHYAFGETNPLVDDAPEYLALGLKAVERRMAYRDLFRRKLPEVVRNKRPELVRKPFIGDTAWIKAQHVAAGLPPPD